MSEDAIATAQKRGKKAGRKPNLLNQVQKNYKDMRHIFLHSILCSDPNAGNIQKIMNAIREKNTEIISVSQMEDKTTQFLKNFEEIANKVNHVRSFQLFDHQRTGFFLARSRMRDSTSPGFLLAHAMGSGKTESALAIAMQFVEDNAQDTSLVTVVVMCPLSVVGQWRQKVKQFEGEYCSPTPVEERMFGNQNLPVLESSRARFFVGTDTIMLDWLPQLILNRERALVVVDEAHNSLMHDETAKSQKLQDVLKQRPSTKLLLLTGTPMHNSVTELYTLCSLLIQSKKYGKVFKSLKEGAETLLGKIRMRTEDGATAEQVQEEQKIKLITSYVTREFLKCVLDRVDAFTVEDNLKNKMGLTLHTYRVNFKIRGKEFAKFNPLISSDVDNTNQNLYKLTAELSMEDNMTAKTAFLKSLIKDKLDKDQKVILFFLNTAVGKKACDLLESMTLTEKEFKFVDGSTTNRQDIWDDFNYKNECKVLVTQYMVGGVGVNLQIGGSVVVFLQPHFNPAIIDQSIARVWRTGQTKSCEVYHLITLTTAEEVAFVRYQSKRQVNLRVLDNKTDETALKDVSMRALGQLREKIEIKYNSNYENAVEDEFANMKDKIVALDFIKGKLEDEVKVQNYTEDLQQNTDPALDLDEDYKEYFQKSLQEADTSWNKIKVSGTVVERESNQYATLVQKIRQELVKQVYPCPYSSCFVAKGALSPSAPPFWPGEKLYMQSILDPEPEVKSYVTEEHNIFQDVLDQPVSCLVPKIKFALPETPSLEELKCARITQMLLHNHIYRTNVVDSNNVRDWHAIDGEGENPWKTLAGFVQYIANTNFSRGHKNPFAFPAKVVSNAKNIVDECQLLPEHGVVKIVDTNTRINWETLDDKSKGKLKTAVREIKAVKFAQSLSDQQKLELIKSSLGIMSDESEPAFSIPAWKFYDANDDETVEKIHSAILSVLQPSKKSVIKMPELQYSDLRKCQLRRIDTKKKTELVFSKLKSTGSGNILNGYMRYEMLGKCVVVRYERIAEKRLSTILKQQWNDVLDISCVRIIDKDLTFVRDGGEWWMCEQGDINRVEDINIFNGEIVEFVVYCLPEIKKDSGPQDVTAAMPQAMIEETPPVSGNSQQATVNQPDASEDKTKNEFNLLLCLLQSMNQFMSRKDCEYEQPRFRVQQLNFVKGFLASSELSGSYIRSLNDYLNARVPLFFIDLVIFSYRKNQNISLYYHGEAFHNMDTILSGSDETKHIHLSWDGRFFTSHNEPPTHTAQPIPDMHPISKIQTLLTLTKTAMALITQGSHGQGMDEFKNAVNSQQDLLLSLKNDDPSYIGLQTDSHWESFSFRDESDASGGMLAPVIMPEVYHCNHAQFSYYIPFFG